MKHLIHKNHHPHLKKRALLEAAGFLALLAFSFSQREVISEAIRTISRVEAGWFILLLASFWLLYPLTALSYKLISPKPKKISLLTTSLAHLAGAGPGRIIPGGIGNMSIGAVHLKKSGFTIEQGIAIVATNNALGIFANIVLLIGVLVIRPETVRILTENISSQQILLAIALSAAAVVVLQWALHAHRTRHEVLKTTRSWRKLLINLGSSRKRMLYVTGLAFAILIVHVFLLAFSGSVLGINLHFMDALIALTFGVAIGSIFPTPGGIGAVEAGTTAALVVLGYEAAVATSIALLFRVVTYWQPLIPGTLAYLYLREKRLL